MRAFFCGGGSRPQILDNFALFPANYLRVKTSAHSTSLVAAAARTYFELVQARSLGGGLYFFNIHRESSKNLASDGLKGVRSSVRLGPLVKRHFGRVGAIPWGLISMQDVVWYLSRYTQLCNPAAGGVDFIVKEPPPFDNILHRPGRATPLSSPSSLPLPALRTPVLAE